jgi:mono/diheme cytochrome c family protein
MIRPLVLPVAILAALAFPGRASAQSDDAKPRGQAVYERWCASCHGETGAGDGEAAQYMLPRPRDFTRGVYQIRTTKSGQIPTDGDLHRVVHEGMPGTAMPGWREILSDEDHEAVVAYIKTFSKVFQGGSAQPLTFSDPPGTSEETIRDGEAAYRELQCARCHGNRGRGDGTSAPTLVDNRGDRIRAADLSAPWLFNGGSTVEQIYRTLRTGLDGTPMGSFSDVIDAGLITDERLWHVAQYVRSLAPETIPETREVIRAARVDAVPAAPDDPSWEEIPFAHVPLAGQIIEAPRWFAPQVASLRVRALHDDKTLAILVSWSDPSRSPDDAWQEWLDGMASGLPRVDGDIPRVQGPDRLHVQFPAEITDGLERPRFLAGEKARPVYQWRWSGQPDEVRVGKATGLAAFTAGATTGVSHRAVWVDGEWRVLFVRALESADAAAAPSFPRGFAIPIAFYAADGSSGEDEVRGAISTWYAIYLDVPIPRRVFVTPILAGLLTAAFGILVTWQAQRRASTGGTRVSD